MCSFLVYFPRDSSMIKLSRHSLDRGQTFITRQNTDILEEDNTFEKEALSLHMT